MRLSEAVTRPTVRSVMGVPTPFPETDPGGLPPEEPGVPSPDPGPRPYPVDDPPYPEPTGPDTVPVPEPSRTPLM
ncbi:hypothetical protein [Prosthecomicrobium sp. N25]|uniref:hypothetical protein n=1 Tax=Prosthecomicrobium sp. N25 TaxID=3129254 RepID=UPI0030771003